MTESNIKDLEKTLSLKVQEIESLKAQNGRLIEKLQEEIDKSSSNQIQKEIIHKEILQIHMTMREVFQQGQIKNVALEKIYSKVNELELKFQDQIISSATNYGKYVSAAISDEIDQLKVEMMKIQSKETNLERSVLEMSHQIQEQNRLIKLATKSALVSKPSSDDISTLNTNTTSETIDDKISLELKNEFGTKEDLNLILQMINENK
jgi:hypothetical protein